MTRNAILIVLGSVVVCLLVLADIALRVRSYKRDAFFRRVAVTDLYTNGTSGMLISDRIKDQPLWAIWNFKGGDSVSCFVEGKLVLGVTYVPEGRAETEVNFYGRDGKLISQWKSRGNGVFYGRTFFSEAGARSEAWFNERWHNVEFRTNNLGKVEKGIILEEKWRQLILTNGVLRVKN